MSDIRHDPAAAVPSAITTHVLDTALGLPARGMTVMLECSQGDDHWDLLGQGITDSDGRLTTLLPPSYILAPGVYRLTFETGLYFSACGSPAFYPLVQVTFCLDDLARHHHIPLLLSPYGYSTYRGS